jgi:transposase
MDASVILQIKPELTRFLHQFDGYFGRVTTRRYLDLYVQGQLGPLPRKSIEPMADAFGEPPRNLQEFLSLFRWDEQGVRNELQQYVVRRHGSAQSVLAYSPRIREIPWETYHVKDGAKGPLVWQAKRLLVYLPDEQGLPTRPYHLLVARNVLDLKEIKYFLSNAPESTSVPTLLRVAFTRWIIERAFEDSKTDLGLDHFEVRKFGSIQRHLILSCLSHVFLSEFCLKHRGENPDLTFCQTRTATALLVPLWTRGRHCSRKYAEQIVWTGRGRIDPRAALNGILYQIRSGGQWNHLPEEFGDNSSVHRTFQRWVQKGVLERIWATLVENCEELGRGRLAMAERRRRSFGRGCGRRQRPRHQASATDHRGHRSGSSPANRGYAPAPVPGQGLRQSDEPFEIVT